MTNSRISGEEQKAKGKIEPFDMTNAVLYATGKKYAAQLDKKSLTGKAYAARKRAIAAKFGVETSDVQRAVEFTLTVDRIAASCGGAAKKLILANHPRLPVEKVMQIGRTHPDRQRFALKQVKKDHNPFCKPPPGIEPPFDTLGYGEVLNRLGRNVGHLHYVADGMLNTPAKKWPMDTALRKMADDRASILTAYRGMNGLVKKFSGRLKVESGSPQRKSRKLPSAFNPLKAHVNVGLVLGVTAKNLRDLPRLIREMPPTKAQAHAVLNGLARLRRSAERFKAVLRTRGQNPLMGPLEVPGTYIVFYQLHKAARALKVGALGKFNFPAGFYAYLGSAFGGGGVRKRTNRHLTAHSPKKWNVDWLKPLCTPVAVWWTHDRDKVEFDWASALAGLPGAQFPVPGFGASDNPKASAHLARFDRMPSIEAFRRWVAKAMKGHAPVYQKVVEGWKGAGWPE